MGERGGEGDVSWLDRLPVIKPLYGSQNGGCCIVEGRKGGKTSKRIVILDGNIRDCGSYEFQRGSGNRQCFQLKFVQGDDAPPFPKNTSRIENLLQSKKAGECLASHFGFWMNCKMEGTGEGEERGRN